ncbi:hypothetical protein F5882DRAFT_445043 [Hyaloscypha sp. PMI_1271]|nr:hypothetical protein F5882DRAFT_445043 [Hyaloscypha sp. PMI_1271]
MVHEPLFTSLRLTLTPTAIRHTHKSTPSSSARSLSRSGVKSTPTFSIHSYGTVQHIRLSNNKLTHMRCASPTSPIYFQTQSARNDACVPYDTAYRKSVQNGREIVSLLLSCRQTYLEIIEIIYSSTAFRLPVSAATQLIATVPAPYMALAHLHLSFPLTSPMYLPPRAWPIGFTAANTNPKADEAEWEAFWRAFARLRVRALVVEILDLGVRVPEGVERSGEFGDAGFVVRRLPEPEGTDLMVQMNVERGNPGVRKERGGWGD